MVGAGIMPVALGTDTAGSIRIPAHHCGAFGYRPTIDRWPQAYGVISTTLRDSIGPIIASALDITILDEVITGKERMEVMDTSILTIGVPSEHFWEDLDPEVA